MKQYLWKFKERSTSIIPVIINAKSFLFASASIKTDLRRLWLNLYTLRTVRSFCARATTYFDRRGAGRSRSMCNNGLYSHTRVYTKCADAASNPLPSQMTSPPFARSESEVLYRWSVDVDVRHLVFCSFICVDCELSFFISCIGGLVTLTYVSSVA